MQVLHQSENFLAVDKMADLVMNTNPGDDRYLAFNNEMLTMRMIPAANVEQLCPGFPSQNI